MGKSCEFCKFSYHNNNGEFCADRYPDKNKACGIERKKWQPVEKEKPVKECSTCGNRYNVNYCEMASTCYDHSSWKPIKEKEMKPTNEQIVEAAGKCITDRWEPILNDKKTMGESVCALCDLFSTSSQYNPDDCGECPFPGDCNDPNPVNSYGKFFNHYHEVHGKYLGSVRNEDEHVAGTCCEPFVKAIIKDLEEIIEKYSEVEKFYAVGDVFEDASDNLREIVCVGNPMKMATRLLMNSKISIKGDMILDIQPVIVKNDLSISEKEIAMLIDAPYTHISGPTFKPENLCPCGFEFGKDYDKCGNPSACNKNPVACFKNPKYKETLWHECKEQSKNK